VFFTFPSGRVFADVCLQPNAPDIILDAAVALGAGGMEDDKLALVVLDAFRASDTIPAGTSHDASLRMVSDIWAAAVRQKTGKVASEALAVLAAAEDSDGNLKESTLAVNISPPATPHIYFFLMASLTRRTTISARVAFRSTLSSQLCGPSEIFCRSPC
jgi:hypothetical protein